MRTGAATSNKCFFEDAGLEVDKDMRDTTSSPLKGGVDEQEGDVTLVPAMRKKLDMQKMAHEEIITEENNALEVVKRRSARWASLLHPSYVSPRKTKKLKKSGSQQEQNKSASSAASLFEDCHYQ